MRGHQHAALIPTQLVVEPRPALSIQMVSRFVQQKKVRARRKRPAQQGADALAAAEFYGGLIRLKRWERRTDKRFAQTFGYIPVAVEQRQIVRLIITTVNALTRSKNRVIPEKFSQRRLRRNNMLLRHPGMRAKAFNMTGSRFVQPRQQAQQTRFSAAVAANQRAQGGFQREIQRTKKGIARRKLTGDLMQNKRRGLRKMSHKHS